MKTNFEIFKGSNGKYYFRLRAQNHEIILASQAYASKQACQKGIRSVKVNARDASQFEPRIAKDDTFYFVLKAKNGRVVGVSETYNSKPNMEKGRDAVMRNAR